MTQAQDYFERHADQLETRRRLLSTAVRLTPALTPELFRTVDSCVEKLRVGTTVELYVQPSPHLNAACFRPEAGRVFLMFSSELLEAFDAEELAFVTGHELGHHVFDHHSIPVGLLLHGKSKVPPRLALQLFAWSRFAEVSADRAGLFCCGDLNAVARALFKLASGLRSGAAHIVMDALLAQVQDIESFGDATADAGPRADWFSTHPFSPLRLKTAKLFADSAIMRDGGVERDELERSTDAVMSLMEPGYLKEDTDAAIAMRRLLLAGAMVVAAASGGVSEAEVEAIEEFLGEGKVTRHLSVEALREDLPRRIQAVVDEATKSRRAQVLRDLCVIAKADGPATGDERRELEAIARGLGLGVEIVCRTIDCSSELD